MLLVLFKNPQDGKNINQLNCKLEAQHSAEPEPVSLTFHSAFHFDPLTNMAILGNSCFLLVDF
jgi:galactose mutarotase-like enzyme